MHCAVVREWTRRIEDMLVSLAVREQGTSQLRAGVRCYRMLYAIPIGPENGIANCDCQCRWTKTVSLNGNLLKVWAAGPTSAAGVRRAVIIAASCS